MIIFHSLNDSFIQQMFIQQLLYYTFCYECFWEFSFEQDLGASLVSQLVKNLPTMWETWVQCWVRKIPWRRDRLPMPVLLGFPSGWAGKESACNAGDLGLIPRLGRSPGEGKGYPLQYSGLENSMHCIVHAKSQTRLSNFHCHLHDTGSMTAIDEVIKL